MCLSTRTLALASSRQVGSTSQSRRSAVFIFVNHVPVCWRTIQGKQNHPNVPGEHAGNCIIRASQVATSISSASSPACLHLHVLMSMGIGVEEGYHPGHALVHKVIRACFSQRDAPELEWVDILAYVQTCCTNTVLDATPRDSTKQP